MIREGRKYDRHCKFPPTYHLKCNSTEHCNCRTNRSYRRRPTRNQPRKEKNSSTPRRNRKYKHYMKKTRRSWNKSNKCFACGQERHYAKQCPNKRAKSAKLIQHLRHVVDEIPSNADIESFFSEQEDVNQLTSFMVQDSDDSSTSSEQLGYTDHGSPLEVYQATSNGSKSPHVKIQILTTKYSKPVRVIAYFDTGAHSSMMNPNVLPSDAWKEEKNEFLAADGQIFNTYLISKHKVSIQFFPSFTLWTQASSSTAPLVVPPPPTFPPEFMATLPHGQLPSVQQVHGFTKSYLPRYLAQINDQGCHHLLANPSKPFLDPFISLPFYYYSDQNQPPRYAAFGFLAVPTVTTHIPDSFEIPMSATNEILRMTTKGCTRPASRSLFSISFMTSTMTKRTSFSSSQMSHGTQQGAGIPSRTPIFWILKTRLTRDPVLSVGPQL
ncbi:hypothetical protein Ddye_020655 [Dipteronia dyeriana]|uniref:CCHC-type domain-containing protein n=1 Tax=Dipteronia dyeriana TaxID=168575 RepID=A0AAD9U173_9ROSI|nr:hypothetical protein Ddye_020655 [Dipteronia dyeriana]